MLLNHLDLPFNENDYEYIKELSSIHKLTYKLKENVLERENTFYAKLMEENMLFTHICLMLRFQISQF